MPSLEEAVATFLAEPRIAVCGVSRQGGLPANAIYRKLRAAGHAVFAVNPNATEVEGDPAYPDLAAIEGGVGAVMIATPPGAGAAIVEQCTALGVRHVWFHRSFGAGSVSSDAVALARDRGLNVIPGSCPMMFVEPVDGPHRCLRWFLRVTGKAPEPIAPAGPALD